MAGLLREPIAGNRRGCPAVDITPTALRIVPTVDTISIQGLLSQNKLVIKSLMPSNEGTITHSPRVHFWPPLCEPASSWIE